MGMGRKKQRQESLWVPTQDLALNGSSCEYHRVGSVPAAIRSFDKENGKFWWLNRACFTSH